MSNWKSWIYFIQIDYLLNRTQHVVAVQTVTKAEFRSPQTHEFEAMQKIIPAVQAKGMSGILHANVITSGILCCIPIIL